MAPSSRPTIISAKSIYPDIVVHQREIPNNLLAIEVRKASNHQPPEHDQHKLRGADRSASVVRLLDRGLSGAGKEQRRSSDVYVGGVIDRPLSVWFAERLRDAGLGGLSKMQESANANRTMPSIVGDCAAGRWPASSRAGRAQTPAQRRRSRPRYAGDPRQSEGRSRRSRTSRPMTTARLAEQKRITEIPAPPYKEKVRAEYYLKRFAGTRLQGRLDRRRRQCDRAAQGQRRRPAEAGGVGASRHRVSRRHRRHREGKGRRHPRAGHRRRLARARGAAVADQGHERQRHRDRRRRACSSAPSARKNSAISAASRRCSATTPTSTASSRSTGSASPASSTRRPAATATR